MNQDQSIKSFGIDFNWDKNGSARPGLYAPANPEEHVRWYKDLGANTIQTSCVSYNGYAWYRDSAVAPVTPGMTSDFLPEITELAHREGMLCLGYFCLESNPVWRSLHPEAVYACDSPSDGAIDAGSVICTDDYLDYFARMIQDALRKTDIDGFMVDWVRPPQRRSCLPWLSLDKEMYRELMHQPFPLNAKPDSPEIITYDRRVLERAWIRIKEAVESVRPAIIWTNHPFTRTDDPLWNGHRVLQEVDWVLNESPETEMLDWLSRQIGPRTRIIQNLSGWVNHDASAWKKIEFPKYGLYGFAQADPATTLPSTDYTPACATNQKNIKIIREAYHGLP